MKYVWIAIFLMVAGCGFIEDDDDMSSLVDSPTIEVGDDDTVEGDDDTVSSHADIYTIVHLGYIDDTGASIYDLPVNDQSYTSWYEEAIYSTRLEYCDYMFEDLYYPYPGDPDYFWCYEMFVFYNDGKNIAGWVVFEEEPDIFGYPCNANNESDDILLEW